ncbi:hypothetical protein ACP275_04G161500 [Erythranthe tilingii]
MFYLFMLILLLGRIKMDLDCVLMVFWKKKETFFCVVVTGELKRLPKLMMNGRGWKGECAAMGWHP